MHKTPSPFILAGVLLLLMYEMFIMFIYIDAIKPKSDIYERMLLTLPLLIVYWLFFDQSNTPGPMIGIGALTWALAPVAIIWCIYRLAKRIKKKKAVHGNLAKGP